MAKFKLRKRKLSASFNAKAGKPTGLILSSDDDEPKKETKAARIARKKAEKLARIKAEREAAEIERRMRREARARREADRLRHEAEWDFVENSPVCAYCDTGAKATTYVWSSNVSDTDLWLEERPGAAPRPFVDTSLDCAARMCVACAMRPGIEGADAARRAKLRERAMALKTRFKRFDAERLIADVERTYASPNYQLRPWRVFLSKPWHPDRPHTSLEYVDARPFYTKLLEAEERARQAGIQQRRLKALEKARAVRDANKGEKDKLVKSVAKQVEAGEKRAPRKKWKLRKPATEATASAKKQGAKTKFKLKSGKKLSNEDLDDVFLV